MDSLQQSKAQEQGSSLRSSQFFLNYSKQLKGRKSLKFHFMRAALPIPKADRYIKKGKLQTSIFDEHGYKNSGKSHPTNHQKDHSPKPNGDLCQGYRYGSTQRCYDHIIKNQNNMIISIDTEKTFGKISFHD